jgi:hypothetical protein
LKIPPISIPTPYLNHASNNGGVNVVEFGRKKIKVLRVTMDKLYNMLVQDKYLPIKNESSLRKSDNFVGSTKQRDITSMNVKSFTRR